MPNFGALCGSRSLGSCVVEALMPPAYVHPPFGGGSPSGWPLETVGAWREEGEREARWEEREREARWEGRERRGATRVSTGSSLPGEVSKAKGRSY